MIQLNEKYNREEFIDFLENTFLPDFKKDFRKVDHKGLTTINKAHFLGESKKLDLQIFELFYPQSNNNKRVSLATDGFKIMKQSATFQALVIFSCEDSNDWRLSLMTATPERNKKGGVVVRLSNPRRYSFALGKSTKINTPHNFLIKKGQIIDFEDLKSRFSIEVVNKEFYNEIAKLYTKLVGGTRGQGEKELKFPGIIELPSVPKDSPLNHEFAVRLIGRLIFCWFLREKKDESDISLVPKEILSLEAVKNNKDYYHTILESLFFEILNKPQNLRKDIYLKEPYSKIPYLNGGLFLPQTWDYYEQELSYLLKIPDDWLIEFFEILEQYNFTVDENTSVDVDLSIDPEMLGRIFENLLAEINPETGESARKSTGSYYTPRTIVEYMVDESLFQYLKEKTGIEESKLRALISYDLNDDDEFPIEESGRRTIIEALSNVTILDPACGSGAYPIGALQKIVFILQRIDPEAKLWFQQQITFAPPEMRRLIEKEFAHHNFDYIRKLGIIRESVFGIDIQPIATEIARLRCFLTLVVDERIDDKEQNRGIEPLPNLDFKFVTANSLIGLPNSQNVDQMGLFEDEEGIKQLKEVRNKYFNASGTEREQLKLQFVQIQNKMFQKMISGHHNGYADLTTKLSSWNPFEHEASDWFDPDWMFGIKNGFDIVIGNPPYGLLNKKQNQKLGHQVSEIDLKYFKNNPIYKPAQGGMVNAFRLFVCQSIELLKEDGNTSLIFPMAFMCDLSASNLRKYILDNYRIDYLEAFPERDNERKRVFEAVKMSVCVLGVTKNHAPNFEFPMRIHADKYIDQSNQKSMISSLIIKKIDVINYTIPLVNPQELKILTKIRTRSVRLEEIGKCYTGEVDLTFNKNFLTENPSDSKLIKGAQVQKYKLLDKMSQGEIMYLNEDMYLKSTDSDRSTHHKLRRIVMQGITGVNEKVRLKMTVIEPPTYCANSVNYLVVKNGGVNLEFLLGLLNSKLMNWCFKTMSTNSNVNGYEVDNLPIVNATKHDQQKISIVVKEILKLSSLELIDEYEDQIDQFVYKLYNLTQDEIAVVEGMNEKK